MITNQNSLFKSKYLKYKKKYLDLKSMLELKQKGGTYNYVFDSIIYEADIYDNESPIPLLISKFGENLICLMSDSANTRKFFKVINQNGEDIREHELSNEINVKDFCVMDERIYILDIRHSKVIILNNNFEQISSFGELGDGNNEFDMPCGIAVYNNQIFISDTNNRCIKIFDLEGNYIRKINVMHSNISRPSPENILVLNESIFVKVNDFCIFKYQIDGTFLQIIGNQNGRQSNQPGEFNNITDIKKYDENHFIVSEYGNERLQIINVDGTFVSQITENDLSAPLNICVDEQTLNIFVINKNYRNENTILKYVKEENLETPNNQAQTTQRDLTPPRNLAFEFDEEAEIQEQMASTTDGQVSIIKHNISKTYGALTGGKTIKIYNLSVMINNNEKTLYNFEIIDVGKNKAIINLFNTLYENKDKLLEPGKKPYFKEYIFGTDNPLPSIDLGGVTRTVFDNLSELLKSKLFELFIKDKDSKLLSLKSLSPPSRDLVNYEEELSKYRKNLDEYKFLGALFGLAIKLGLQITVDLDPLLLYKMIHDDFDSLTGENIIQIIDDYNPKLFKNTPYKCFSKDWDKGWEKDTYCKFNSETFETNTEDTVIPDTVEKIKEMANTDVNKLPLDAFVSGFRDTLNIDAIGLKNKSIGVLDKLIVGERVMNFKKLLDNIVFDNFNSQDKIDFIKNIINLNLSDAIDSAEKQIRANIKPNESEEVIEKLVKETKLTTEEEYIKKLVKFITGSSSIPAGGFTVSNPLIIQLVYLGESVCTSHTCFNRIDIDKEQFNTAYQTKLDNGNIKETELYKTFSLPVLTIESNKLSIA